MKNKKEITPKPIMEGMTYDDNCWVAINTSSENETEVIFYNPSQVKDIDDGFDKLESFAEIVFEDHFSISGDNDTETDLKPAKCTKSGCATEEVEDYDEESGRCWKEWAANGQIIDVYKNIPLDKLPELIEAAKKDLKTMEEGAIENAADTKLYNKDPYAYHGVSRSDFF
jgi:hypothetical protein